VHRSYTWAERRIFFNFVSGSGCATSAAKVADLNVGDVLQVAHKGHVGHTADGDRQDWREPARKLSYKSYK